MKKSAILLCGIILLLCLTVSCQALSQPVKSENVNAVPENKEEMEDLLTEEELQELEKLEEISEEPVSAEDEIYEDMDKLQTDAEFPYRIKINRIENCITVYGLDLEGNYSIPVKAIVCSTGTATPLGTFHTTDKYDWKILKGNVWGQYSTRITGHILFHSVPLRRKTKDSLIVPYYNKLGTKASAGCIRLTTIDAKWILDHCPSGTEVVIYDEKGNVGPLGKPEALKLPADSKWDPTDPDPQNPWNIEPLILNVFSERTFERGEELVLDSGISASDNLGNDLTEQIKIEHTIKADKPGTYSVIYSISDNRGNQLTKPSKAIVKDTKGPQISGIQKEYLFGKENLNFKELLASGIEITDAGEVLSKEHLKILYGDLKEGENRVVFVAEDDYGNTSQAESRLVLDLSGPVFKRKADSSNGLSFDQVVDEIFAKEQVTAADSSGFVSEINVEIEMIDWGYRITYSASDAFSNVGTYTDTIKYTQYHLEIKEPVDLDSPLESLIIKDDAGNEIAKNSSHIKIKTNITDGYMIKGKKKRYVTYTVLYTSPCGTKSISAIGSGIE